MTLSQSREIGHFATCCPGLERSELMEKVALRCHAEESDEKLDGRPVCPSRGRNDPVPPIVKNDTRLPTNADGRIVNVSLQTPVCTWIS
jgi:hypothetical protein